MTKLIVRVLNAVMDFLNDVAEWFYVDWFEYIFRHNWDDLNFRGGGIRGSIEWKEVEPEREEWKRQIDIMFCEICKIGSLIYYDGNPGWSYIIDGIEDFLFADTEEDAKKEFIEIIASNCDDYIAHYTAIKESIGRQ